MGRVGVTRNSAALLIAKGTADAGPVGDAETLRPQIVTTLAVGP